MDSFDYFDISLSFGCVRGELRGSVSVCFSRSGDPDLICIESKPVILQTLHMASNFVEYILPYARTEYAGGQSTWPHGQFLYTVDFHPDSDDLSSDLESVDCVHAALAVYNMVSYFGYHTTRDCPDEFFDCVNEFLDMILSLYPEAFEGDS